MAGKAPRLSFLQRRSNQKYDICFRPWKNKDEGFGRVYVAFWALGLQLYFAYKLFKAKRASLNVVDESAHIHDHTHK